MYKDALRPAWVEINLNNLDFNIKNIKAKIGDRQMIGVIKADAYGHGSVKVAEVLRENGCKTFAVATIHEVITLREAGAKEERARIANMGFFERRRYLKVHLT